MVTVHRSHSSMTTLDLPSTSSSITKKRSTPSHLDFLMIGTSMACSMAPQAKVRMPSVCVKSYTGLALSGSVKYLHTISPSWPLMRCTLILAVVVESELAMCSISKVSKRSCPKPCDSSSPCWRNTLAFLASGRTWTFSSFLSLTCSSSVSASWCFEWFQVECANDILEEEPGPPPAIGGFRARACKMCTVKNFMLPPLASVPSSGAVVPPPAGSGLQLTMTFPRELSAGMSM
mmetsp:Transcript_102739/g.290902  ORF Transcript_102739/g.290902 Transcript_102739/m.290902 type:complete len:233 (+) Transcript_102739:631-1329(+)